MTNTRKVEVGDVVKFKLPDGTYVWDEVHRIPEARDKLVTLKTYGVRLTTSILEVRSKQEVDSQCAALVSSRHMVNRVDRQCQNRATYDAYCGKHKDKR